MPWDARRSYHCLALRDIELQVRVGVYAAEKAAAQPIRVDVELYRHAGRFTGTRLADCLDYDRIHRWLVETWPGRPHVELLETLAEELAGKCLEDARVEACRVLIHKPAAYAGRGFPEIEVYRRRENGNPTETIGKRPGAD
jgi:dihydroneopterin aldolase